MLILNRQIVNGKPYRYAYQGQEKDPETGKEAFQLRLWDGRIGRWLTVDPKREFSSPYLGMGNNPMNRIDPDGGKTDDWYKDKDTGEVVWFDGSYDIEGYEHLGYNYMDQNIDFNGLNRFYDGATKSSYLGTGHFFNRVDYSFEKSFNNSSVMGFIHENLSNPILSVAQGLGKSLAVGFQGAGVALYESTANGRDVEGMGFTKLGYSPIFDIEYNLAFNNGKWINRNRLSLGEQQFAQDFFLDAFSLSLNKLPLPKALSTGNSFYDFMISSVRDFFIMKGVNESVNNLHFKN